MILSVAVMEQPVLGFFFDSKSHFSLFGCQVLQIVSLMFIAVYRCLSGRQTDVIGAMKTEGTDISYDLRFIFFLSFPPTGLSFVYLNYDSSF